MKNIKSFILLAILALVSVGGWGRLTAQAATQAASPLLAGQTGAAAQTGCAPAPVLDRDEWGPDDKPAITAAEAQQIAEAHVQAGCAWQIKLDEEDCRLVYKVKVSYIKVEVDARTGAIIDTDYDD